LESQKPGLYVIIGLTILVAILSIMGVVVQYSKLGDLAEKKKLKAYSLAEKEGARSG
jgi:hypothetical protein